MLSPAQTKVNASLLAEAETVEKEIVVNGKKVTTKVRVIPPVGANTALGYARLMKVYGEPGFHIKSRSLSLTGKPKPDDA